MLQFPTSRPVFRWWPWEAAGGVHGNPVRSQIGTLFAHINTIRAALQCMGCFVSKHITQSFEALVTPSVGAKKKRRCRVDPHEVFQKTIPPNKISRAKSANVSTLNWNTARFSVHPQVVCTFSHVGAIIAWKHGGLSRKCAAGGACLGSTKSAPMGPGQWLKLTATVPLAVVGR